MKKLFGCIFFILLLTGTSNADWFHVMVVYDCNKIGDFIAVKYMGAYNEAGEKMLSQKPENAWNPWDLIETDGDSQILKTKVVERKCSLSDGGYKIIIEPAPGNYNINGRCGAHMFAKASISKNGKLIKRVIFDQDCHNWDNKVITELKVVANTIAPKLKEVSKTDFYK